MREAASSGREPPSVKMESDGATVRLSGSWTTRYLRDLYELLDDLKWPPAEHVTLDASALQPLDTGGAWVLRRMIDRLEAQGHQSQLHGLAEEYNALLALVGNRMTGFEIPAPPKRKTVPELVGRNVWSHVTGVISLMSFIGEGCIKAARSVVNPLRVRWRAVLRILERDGVDALPIVGLLSFLLGIVISYQGGVALSTYGANIFIVELVGLTTVRELAPLMAAIIVAGRTGSAFTAEIGTMKVTEEVDALETLGIDPFEMLVLPKTLGLVIALPLLTVFASAMGVLGGMVMAATMLDVSFQMFIDRIPEAISLKDFLSGIAKAPVFAAIIAMVGCFQGFGVSGGADSVGRQTTVSVVQAIFMVIVADAGFSIIFSILGI